MDQEQCPCGSSCLLDNCCKPYLDGIALAPSPEALMRSRYTAFVLNNVDYLQKTMRGAPLKTFDTNNTLKWLSDVSWEGLTIINAKQKSPTLGFVSFDARYWYQGKLMHICEKSEFHFIDHQWFYIGGRVMNPHRAI